jgi:hypothetical protein
MPGLSDDERLCGTEEKKIDKYINLTIPTFELQLALTYGSRPKSGVGPSRMIIVFGAELLNRKSRVR